MKTGHKSLKGGKVVEKLLQSMHHLQFPLLRGKRKAKQSHVFHLDSGRPKMVETEEIKLFFNHSIILIAFNVLIIQGLFPEDPDAI